LDACAALRSDCVSIISSAVAVAFGIDIPSCWPDTRCPICATPFPCGFSPLLHCVALVGRLLAGFVKHGRTFMNVVLKRMGTSRRLVAVRVFGIGS
jgi:hypothetical protein